MFILFGECLQTGRDRAGLRKCDRCDREEEFFHITEVRERTRNRKATQDYTFNFSARLRHDFPA